MHKIAGDTHTHTIACQHAYSTITENARYAASQGHRFLAITDHTPSMPGCVHNWYFVNMPRFVPRVLEGVVILRGCELNVLEDGTGDLDNSEIAELDWVIASMHRGIMPVGLAPEKYTLAWLKIAENPYIDCIGHMGHGSFACDYEMVISAVAQHGKAVEVNSSSPTSRPGCEDNCRRIVELCKQYSVPIVLSSDSHFHTCIGNVEWASQLVDEVGYPEEKILNLDYSRMRAWLINKKGLELPE